MGTENFEYDGTTLPATADNVEADGAILSEIRADGTTYWLRDAGGGATTVNMPSSVSVGSLGFTPDDGDAKLSFQGNGEIRRSKQTPSGFVTNEYVADWINDKTDPSFDFNDFEIRGDLDSGDTPTGSALGVWLNFNAEWRLVETVAGNSKTANMTIQIREKANHANIGSTSATIFASKED